MSVAERTWTGQLEKIDDYRWRIPTSYACGMRVPGLIFSDEHLLGDITTDQSLQQVANVAHLPGIVKASMAMPDIHWGYGFPIGGVAAVDAKEGVISPGGVGYDINCGVRLMRTDLTVEEVQPKIRPLVAALFRDIPCGVGMRGEIRVSKKDADRVMTQGSRWMIGQGYGVKDDVEHTESRGCLEGADPSAVSDRAFQRGADQLGTLGSGNHFLEVQAVETVYDEPAANVMGLAQGQVAVMIHSGSRGFGYQICDDYLDVTETAMAKYGISVPDRQLACAPLASEEGQRYLAAMRCAANYAWSNRQCLMQLARHVFERVFGKSWESLGMRLVYDVAHNIAKFETHSIDGTQRLVCVHRKGATRAFPPGHPETPEAYRAIGQPVIIPGDMGRNSYVLVGTQQAMEESFGSCCHGAGRVMSRTQAVKQAAGRSIEQELEKQGVIVMGRGRKGVAEEQPAAYKDVNDVVRVVHNAGLAKRVVRLRPLGVIKG
ncbi:MAG: RtcB family protein [Candidatus Omnitrophica bacterium]|nr:RtcB family protein [Candidatus Omnitrophota bacterium]